MYIYIYIYLHETSVQQPTREGLVPDIERQKDVRSLRAFQLPGKHPGRIELDKNWANEIRQDIGMLMEDQWISGYTMIRYPIYWTFFFGPKNQHIEITEKVCCQRQKPLIVCIDAASLGVKKGFWCHGSIKTSIWLVGQGHPVLNNMRTHWDD